MRTPLVLLGLVGSVLSFESHVKLRTHRDLIQSVFTKNFDLLLSRVEKEQEKDAPIPELGTTLTDLHVGIRPIGGKPWSEMTPFETFFDENQVVFEGHDLEFQGKGMLTDPSSGALEMVAFHAPLSTCQIVVALGEEYAAWGSLYPRFNVEQVLFQVDSSLVTVSAYGQLPMYQSHNFEKEVKKWFVSQLGKRQAEFKASLQAVEQNVWRNAPFSQKLFMGAVTLNHSLAESLKIQGDHVLASFLHELDHPMDSDFEEKLVPVNPSFSEANDFKKDVQLVFDENLINNHFQALFNANRVISLMETVIGWLPDRLQTYAKALSAFFTTMGFAKVFPEVAVEYGVDRKLDIRCGFSRAFLSEKLSEHHTS